MLAMLRVIGLVVVSLYAFVPAFATPVRLSSPDGVYSDVIRTQLRLRIERPGIDRPSRTERPSPDLLHSYDANTGTYNDKPKFLPNEEADAPLEVDRERTLDDRTRCTPNPSSSSQPRLPCSETYGR
jgi:hypothetical protein